MGTINAEPRVASDLLNTIERGGGQGYADCEPDDFGPGYD